MQTRSFSTPAASLLAGLALAIGAGPAAAQVDEILVTAQRREESLQDVPVAVSAFTVDQIANRQIDVVKDIGQNVPNLQTYTVTAGAEAIQIHSRGASVQNPGFNLSESPVGIYVDDVYYGRLASVNMELLDVERIEVLRGPQGTLYGRNTIAGAVKIISRTPGDETWLTGSVGIGNYETTEVGVSLGGPIEEGSLAGSIAATYNRRNKGWMNNGTTGEQPGEYDNKAARAKLHWYGTSGLDATLTGWVADVENDGYNGIPYVPFSNDIAGSPNPGLRSGAGQQRPAGRLLRDFQRPGRQLRRVRSRAARTCTCPSISAGSRCAPSRASPASTPTSASTWRAAARTSPPSRPPSSACASAPTRSSTSGARNSSCSATWATPCSGSSAAIT